MKKITKDEVRFELDQIEKQILSYQKATGHRRPVTRREFLGAGVISTFAYSLIPSALGSILNSTKSHAVQCTAPESDMIPFININLAGGWSAVANWVPKNINGDLLSSYSRIGLGTNPATTTAFANNALFSKHSDDFGFLNGIKSAAQSSTINLTSFVGMPVRSADDTNNNRFDIGGLLGRAGLAGSKLPNLSTGNSSTGVGQQPSFNIYPTSPLRVINVNNILNSVNLSGSLTALNTTQQQTMIQLIKELSIPQARSLASLSGGANISALVECSADRNLNNIAAGAGDLDPRNRPELGSIWNFANTTQLARAAMVMNTLIGTAGPIGIEMGGYDYHGNDRVETDSRDRNAGLLTGQILQTAATLGRPVFIYITSDGSVRSQDSSTIASFIGDNGVSGASLMLAFNPSTAPATKNSQIGGFTDANAADLTLPVGGSPELAAAAVFANYLALNRKMNLFDQVLTRAPFTTEQLNRIIMFG